MSIRTVIVSGGNIQKDFALSFLKEHSYEELIAVDNGLRFLYENEITPTRIVGDFDTIDPEIVTWYREHTGIEIRAFNPVKDATDTQIAVELALEVGSSSIVILGGTGSRLDHVLGNIQTLMLPLRAQVECVLMDANNRIRLIDKPISLQKQQQFGQYVSLVPLTTEVNGVTLEGFRYPLQDFTFKSTESAGLGVSNEITADEAQIHLTEGVMILIESRD